MEAIEKIGKYVKGMSFDEFAEDTKTIDAVVRNFEMIGFNNPIKYIDPDGQDYFDPNWAKEWYVEGDSEVNWEALSSAIGLWLQKLIVSKMSGLGENIKEDRLKHGVLGAFLLFCLGILLISAKTSAYLGAITVLLAGLFIILTYHNAEFHNDLWENDPKYRELLETAEYYQKLFEMGVDCEDDRVECLYASG